MTARPLKRVVSPGVVSCFVSSLSSKINVFNIIYDLLQWTQICTHYLFLWQYRTRNATADPWPRFQIRMSLAGGDFTPSWGTLLFSRLLGGSSSEGTWVDGPWAKESVVGFSSLRGA